VFKRERVLACVVSAAVTLAAGCASQNRQPNESGCWPGWARWKQAAKRALTDRGTWIPLAGAAAVSLDDWDAEISEWAVANTPIFGSPERAREAGDTLWLATQLSMVGTALAAPSTPEPWGGRGERLLIQELSVALSGGFTSALKDLSQRERPDSSNLRSFPSGHASQAFTLSRMARFNTNLFPELSGGWRTTLKTTFTVLAAGTAWSRVEGGKHYPSDVLFSAALGNFVAVFIHDAFLPHATAFRIEATIGRHEISLRLVHTFGPGANP
jgi:membrane-associated phospholipid phosphatase